MADDAIRLPRDAARSWQHRRLFCDSGWFNHQPNRAPCLTLSTFAVRCYSVLSPQDPRSQSCVAEEGGSFPSALSFSFSFFLVLVATIGLVPIQPTLLWAHHFSHRQRDPCFSEAGLIPRCGSELVLLSSIARRPGVGSLKSLKDCKTPNFVVLMDAAWNHDNLKHRSQSDLLMPFGTCALSLGSHIWIRPPVGASEAKRGPTAVSRQHP